MLTSHAAASWPRSFVLLAACVIASVIPRPIFADEPPNTLSQAERWAGWRLLFDGTSADEFRGYRNESLGAGWVVEDGALVRKEKAAGDIVTKETFGEFELQLEYRISPGGNSGVMFHVLEDEQAPWMTGPEVQINDNAAGHDPQKAGWLYALYQPPPTPPKPDPTAQANAKPTDPETSPRPPLDATRPAGEWNHLYLRVVPGSGEVCVNGMRYYQFKKGDKDWDTRVAASKFAKFPSFGKSDRGHICLQDHGDLVAFRSIKVRELAAGRPAKQPKDGTAAVKAVPAFPNIVWEGWSTETDTGKSPEPLRPLLVTHADDGSGRRFVLEQSGMIHVVPRGGGGVAKLFLDLRAGARPWKTANEEGLLGLAFHPRFRENGEFFVCYSPVADGGRPQQISRFRVRRDDPDRADPASEEVVLQFEQPFNNHNGGSLVFGTDGFLYIGLGDGGNQRDPLGHGQNTSTWFSSILRIDVDRRDPGRGYAVPADNPLVNVPAARPEIYAWGFRNPWQLSCDRVTGRLWTADVGEDLWEEINVVEKGGNYGWSIREGTKAFGNRGAGERTIDPVWAYDHQIGKSITGGFVYRGKEIPELAGKYLYGDFISGKLWGVDIDAPGGPVNVVIPWDGRPIFGFGSDEAGEAYVTTSSPTGQGVMRLVRDDESPKTVPATKSGHSP